MHAAEHRRKDTARWCSGSTEAFGAFGHGSNPCRAACSFTCAGYQLVFFGSSFKELGIVCVVRRFLELLICMRFASKTLIRIC